MIVDPKPMTPTRHVAVAAVLFASVAACATPASEAEQTEALTTKQACGALPGYTVSPPNMSMFCPFGTKVTAQADWSATACNNVEVKTLWAIYCLIEFEGSRDKACKLTPNESLNLSDPAHPPTCKAGEYISGCENVQVPASPPTFGGVGTQGVTDYPSEAACQADFANYSSAAAYCTAKTGMTTQAMCEAVYKKKTVMIEINGGGTCCLPPGPPPPPPVAD